MRLNECPGTTLPLRDKIAVRASLAILEGIGQKWRLKGWTGVRVDGTEWKVVIPEKYRSEMK